MGQRYQFLPPLSGEEYEALKADIAANGVRVPIDRDEEGEIIDGFHRAQICEELGIECPANVRTGLTETGKREFALSLNLARRHLSREQKQALAVQLRQEGWTQERISHVLCVTHGTVSTWLVQFIDFNELNAPTKVQGKDGKQYSGRKRRHTPGWRRHKAEGTGPIAPTVSPASPASDQPEDSATTGQPMASGVPPDGQVLHENVFPSTGQGHLAPHGVSPNTELLPTDPTGMGVLPLLGLMKTLHDRLLKHTDLGALGRISRSWTPQVRADFLQNLVCVIHQLEAIHQEFAQAAEYEQLAPDVDLPPQDHGHGASDESRNSVPYDEEGKQETAIPEEIDAVANHEDINPHDDDSPHDPHPEAATLASARAADESGSEMPEERAVEHRLETLAAYGLSDRAVARRLNEEGMACPRGNGVWDHRKVARVRERLRRRAPLVA
jgi:Homeodomain-like domain/ParB-like nuclease domain